MNTPIHQLFRRPTETLTLPPNALKMVLFRLGSDLLITAAFIYLAFVVGAWQLGVVAVAAALATLMTIAGIWLVWRNQILGVWLVIGGVLPVMLLISLLVANLGLILALAAILITSISAVLALPSKQVGRAVLAGVVMGIVILLVDIIPLPLDRLTVPATAPTFLLVVLGILILAQGYFIIRQFSHETLRTKLILTILTVVLGAVGLLDFFILQFYEVRMRESDNQKLLAMD